MILTNHLSENDLQKLEQLLADSKEKAISFAEHKIQLRSKKKRQRKKFEKQLLTAIRERKQNQAEEVQVEERANEVSVDVNGLPVTFLLGLGREYFPALDVVKSYYTKTKEEFYKNKELLVATMNESIAAAEPAVQQEVLAKIEARG